MKYCLSARQTKEYLAKADEIKVDYRDHEMILDLIKDYPEATIIINCKPNTIIDFEKLGQYKKLTKQRIIAEVPSAAACADAAKVGLEYYIGYPVSSFFELHALKDLGVCYVRLDNELFFQLDKVKICGVPVRAVPNVAYIDGLRRPNGILGTWIRPEDLEPIYGEYIDAIEFEDADRQKEQALFRIYAEQKEWRGPLETIITNLNADGVNRMIPHEFSRTRTTCSQRCLKGGSCHICERTLFLANPDLLSEYRDQVLK